MHGLCIGDRRVVTRILNYFTFHLGYVFQYVCQLPVIQCQCFDTLYLYIFQLLISQESPQRTINHKAEAQPFSWA